MKKINIKLLVIAAIFCVGIGAVFLIANSLRTNNIKETLETEEKEVIKGYACWRDMTFEEAAKEANTIVYGKVKNKSETFCDDKYSPVVLKHHKEVTIEVLEAIKGVPDGTSTITYMEFGGETDDVIYVLDNYFLTPATIIRVTDGLAKTMNKISPETPASQQTYALDTQAGAYNLEHYIDAIRKAME